MDFYFYIFDDYSTSGENDLKTGPRIVRIPENKSNLNFKVGDGPFKSIQSLKKYSQIFKDLAKRNPKRVQQIIKEENIEKVKNFVIISANSEYKKEFIDLLNHTTGGQIKNKQVYGIHFFDPDRMRIIDYHENDNTNGVWSAKIELFNSKTKEWVKKKKVNTFFPKHWTINQLFHECYYAFIH